MSADSSVHRSSDRWGFLASTTLGRVAVGFQFQAISALAPALGVSLGIGLAELGTLIGLYMLPGVVVALLGGLLLQRYTVRTILIVALFAMICSGIASYFAASFHAHAVVRLFGGFGAVMLTVATLKGLYDWFSISELSFANGISGAAHPFGMGCALVLFTALGPASVGQAGLLATAGVAGLALVAVLLTTRDAPSGQSDEIARGISKMPGTELTLLLMASAVLALYAGCFHALLSLLPSYLSANEWPPAPAASLMAVLGWAPIVMAPVGGVIATKIGHTSAMIATSLFLWGSSVVALAIFGVHSILIAMMVLFGALIMGPVMSLGAQAAAP
jgi:predicted MFS family arabinose efflux permease